MSSTNLRVRLTTVLCSIVVAALSITTFCKIGWATYYFTLLPHGMWFYGPWDTTVPNWEAELKLVTMYCDWSPEIFVWVAAGTSIVAAVCSMIIEAVRVFRSRGSTKDNRQDLSMAMGITTVGWAIIAFVASFMAVIYVNTKHKELEKTCSFVDEPGRTYTCTRERAACEWYPSQNKFDGLAKSGDWEMFNTVCAETKFGRQVVIPLMLFSGLVALGYGSQMWLGKREQSGDADERVRRLQEEEE